MEPRIVESSVLARIARQVLKSTNVAMVIGNTIYLSGVKKEDFLQNKAWVAHELCHIRQFQEHGFWRFLGLYLQETWRHGYYQNKYEIEARLAGAQAARTYGQALPDNTRLG